jgi:hypothetical protein
VHKRIISAVKRVEFVSDRMSYLLVRDCRRHIIGLNVHDPTVGEIHVKDISTRSWNVFNKFPKYHMKTLLGNFSAEVGGKTFSNRQL